MDSHPHWRLRARTALENYFRDRSYPRLILSLLVVIAGFGGFLMSRLLLAQGMTEMGYRYPLAVIAGYVFFLISLRLWVEIERTRYRPQDVQISPEAPPLKGPTEPDFSSWLDWLDPSHFMEAEEAGCAIGCFITFVIGVFVGSATLLVSLFVAGPELLAEVFLDAVVVSMLYRHLKKSAREHWLGTAVKRTWAAIVVSALAVGLFGYGLGQWAPGCHSLGPAVKEIYRQYRATR